MSEQLIKTPCAFGDNGNFLLERELGSGGMGGVYMGRDKMLDRPVAVKVMLKEYGSDSEFVEKFKKEAQSVARLIHPNIAQVYSYGICDGMPYIAMELASGGSLYSIMNANPGKSDIPRVIKICQQVAQALQCASDQGCVHGDVKPENVLLDASGNAKLVDFGLAAMQKDTNEIWGTPYYISPEKVKKEPIDFRADMYSLGGTLYHALTGVAPFEGEDSIAVVKKRFDGNPRKPSEVRPEISPAIDNLVMKMLALDKEDRFPSFEALLQAFKDVLTTGLTTQKLPATTSEAATSAKPTTGAKRMAVRGRRTVMMKKRTGISTGIQKTLDGEKGDEGALDETKRPESDKDDDEDEGGGNLGVKVLCVVIGSILAIGAIIGGLVWYQIADKKARAAEELSQIVGGVAKARAAIGETVSSAIKFADDFDDFAAKAIAECQKPTDELMMIVPEDQRPLLKPETSQELEAAIAATNETPVAAAPVEMPSAPATNAAPAAAAKATTNATSAAVANQAKDAKAKPGPAEAASTNAAPAAVQPSQTVIDMNKLWERAYGCQASAIRIRHSVRKIVKKGAEADEIKDSSRESMEKLAELSRTLVEMLDQVKTSKDVENVKKGITYIRTTGQKTVDQTVRRLRIEKLENDRKAKAEEAAAREKELQDKRDAEKKEMVEKEKAAAQAEFDKIAAQGSFRLLDWKTALRQLDNLKAECQTPEGQLAVELQIRKVKAMKKLQDVLIKSMKGYTFRKSKSKLKGATVVSISEKEIQFERGKGKLKSTWPKFYREYYANFIEAMSQFVFHGRKNAGLSQREVAEALTGSALSLSIICSEEPTAAGHAERLAVEAVKQFPDYLKTAQAIFPDVKFDEVKEDE